MAQNEPSPKIYFDWGESGTAEEEKLFLSWQTTPGKAYQVRLLHGEDVPMLPWPMPSSVIPWQDLGPPLYGAGSIYRLHVYTQLPPGTQPPPGPQLPTMLMVHYQPLSNGSQVVFSWYGDGGACRKVVSGVLAPNASHGVMYGAASYDVFAIGLSLPLEGDVASLETPLSPADAAVWAELLPLVPLILNDESPGLAHDMGGQSAPPGESGQARMWRVEERWPDTDGDGIYDWMELASEAQLAASNPFNVDTDGDGISDGDEKLFGLNATINDMDTTAAQLEYNAVNRLEQRVESGVTQAVGYDN